MEINIKPSDIIGSYRSEHYIDHSDHAEVWKGRHHNVFRKGQL